MTTHDVSTAPGPAPQATAPPEAGEAAGSPEGPMKKARRGKRRRILLALLALLAVLLLLLGLLSAWYLSTGKPLSELPGLANDKMPHYVSSFYGTSRPIGVAVSPSGDRIYVTEGEGTKLVRIYDRTGKKLGTLQPPKSTGPSHQPVYVAVNPITSDVYVSDRPAQSVYIYNAKGAYLRTFVPRGNLGGGWQPLGLAFNADGDLYVTDVSAKAHRVLAFGPDGALTRTLGAKDKLVFPNGIAIDKLGTTYVSDSNNGRLVTIDPVGKLAATISRGAGAGDLGMPRGAAIDNSGRLHVVDTSAHTVKVYRIAAASSASSAAPTVKYLGSFGEEGQVDGAFEFPNGVATDARGRIYVTDRENNRVQVWSY